MFTYVTENEFINAFQELRPNKFSYDGLKALYEYFEEYEDSTGEKIELDVIAICCEHSEYESIEEFNNAYGKEWTLEELQDHTQVIEFEKLINFTNYGKLTNTKIDAFIIQDF